MRTARSLSLILSSPLFFSWNSSQASCEITLQGAQCNGTVTEISADAKTVIPAHVAQLLVLMRLAVSMSRIYHSAPRLGHPKGWRSVCATRRLIEWAHAQIPRLVFMCTRTDKAYRWEAECRTSSSKHTLRETWSSTVTKWKFEWESWPRCNRESGITSGDDHKIRNYPLTLVPTIGERGTSAPAGVFGK